MTEHRRVHWQMFHKLILRMMPAEFSSMGEGKLIASVISQAYLDGATRESRNFFLDPRGGLEYYAAKVGIDASQIRKIYVDHCPALDEPDEPVEKIKPPRLAPADVYKLNKAMANIKAKA